MSEVARSGLARDGGFGHAVFEIARKEILQNIRTARLIVVLSLFSIALLLTTLIFPLVLENAFGDQILSDFPGDSSEQNVAFAIFLGIAAFLPFVGGLFYTQLLSIVLAADAVSSEWQRKTLFLLLSKPVSRSAMIIGKFLGALVSVAVPVIVLCILDYLLLMAVFDGVPGGEDWMRFLGVLGLLVLGIGAYAAMALFVSSITKSTVASFITALGIWIVVFPLISLPADIIYFQDENKAADECCSEGMDWEDVQPDRGDLKYELWRALSPGKAMAAAGGLVVDSEDDDFVLTGMHNPAYAALSLLGWTGLFLGGSVLVARRRNYE